MKNASQELKELLPTTSTQNEHSVFCYFPLLSSASLIILTTTSFIITCFSQGFTELEKLPHSKSSFMSIGIFLSSLPGFFTVWAFHFLIWCKQKSLTNTFCLAFSFISGILTQISLLLLGFTLSEKTFLPKSVIGEQEEVALVIFCVASMIFESFSLVLLLQLGQNTFKPIKKWVVLKLFLLVVILSFSILQGGLAVALQFKPDEALLSLLLSILNYVAFYLHCSYFATFYFDLEDVRLIIGLSKEYEDSVNTSTF